MVPLAVSYLKTQRYAVAKELLTTAVEIDPNNPTAYQHLGFADLKLKNTDLAIANYEMAAKLEPEDWEPHKGLGVAYMLSYLRNKNQFQLKEKAIQQWKISLAIKPDQPKLRDLLMKYSSQ